MKTLNRFLMRSLLKRMKNLEGIKDRKKQLDQKAKEKALKNFQKKIDREENLALFPHEWQELDDAS